jgi:cytoskeletal protein RodZ
MSDSLGKTIAAMRVKKGLSVEEVSAVIRINPKFVRLLEDDQYDHLPGEVFIKGLLRSYAGVVGISGDEVIARYNALGVQIKDRSPALISVPLRPESRLLPRILLPFLILVAVAGVIYYYVGPLEDHGEKQFSYMMDGGKPGAKQVKAVPPGEVKKTDKAPATPPMLGPQLPKEPKPELKEKAAQPKQSSTTVTSTAPSQNLSAPAAIKKPETQPVQAVDKTKHKLTVTASDVSWVSVSVDNGLAKQTFLNTGETATWTAEKGFKLTIGNVRGTKVYLDGAEIKVKNAVQNVIKDMNIPVGKNEKPAGAEG